MTTNKTKEEIEKAYPEAYRLARKFHELYEENAPKFGYTTRGDTKEFDPSSPNGRTMAFVCKTIVDEEIDTALTQQLEELEEVVEGMKGEGCCWCHTCNKYLVGKEIGNPQHDEHISTAIPDGDEIYNQALQDLQAHIAKQKNIISNK